MNYQLHEKYKNILILGTLALDRVSFASHFLFVLEIKQYFEEELPIKQCR